MMIKVKKLTKENANSPLARTLLKVKEERKRKRELEERRKEIQKMNEEWLKEILNK